MKEHDDSLETIFTPVFKQLYEAVRELSLHRPSDIAGCCGLIDFIARNSSLACVLIKSDCWLPPAQFRLFMAISPAFRSPVQGNAYEDGTLLGRLAGLTCIPQPTQQSVSFVFVLV